MDKNFSKIAKSFGLDELALNLYVYLFVHGSMKIDSLVLLSGEKESFLSEVLNEMIVKGFVFKIDDYFFAVPLNRLVNSTGFDAICVKNFQDFMLAMTEDADEIGLIKYEGWDGVKRAYIEVLEEAIQSGLPILAFENGDFTSQLGNDFIKDYVHKRLEYRVRAMVICPNNKSSDRYRSDFSSDLTQVKLLDDFEAYSCFNIVSDVVMTFSDNPIRGTLWRNRSDAKTMASVFHQLWNMEGCN
jgi:hypothetical protein